MKLFIFTLMTVFATVSFAKRRVLVIGIDGATGNQLHYRALIQKKMPATAQLMHEGIYAPCINDDHPAYGGHKDPRCARAHSGPKSGSEFQWLTGPGWLSVLTGVDNNLHGVKDNKPESLAAYVQVRDRYPTFMMRAKESGLKTAAGGVANFLTSTGDKSKPGILDYECGVKSSFWSTVKNSANSSCNLNVRMANDNNSATRDKKLAQFTLKQIQDEQMDVIMSVFDGVDHAGHRYGFTSNDGYLAAFSEVDRLIKPLLETVKSRAQKKSEEWLVILTSDHGGHKVLLWGLHDQREGEDDAIPFIVTTYGTGKKLQSLRYPVTHMDVHPTILAFLGQKSEYVSGRIQGIF